MTGYAPCDHEECFEIAITSDDGTALCNSCENEECDCS